MIVEQMKYKLSVETGGFLDATRKIKNETEDMKTKVKRNTGEVTKGFGELNLGIQKFSAEGKNAFTSVMSGAAKFLGVAVTLEGARRAFVSTTDSLITLGTQAAWLGMNAKHLDAFNRAAESVGSSREAVGSALGRMNEWDIWSKTNVGPAPAYLAAMYQLQSESAVNIMNGKNAEEKTLRAFEAIKSLKNESRAQQLYTSALGLSDPALFQAIRSGEYQKAFEEYKGKSLYTPEMEAQAKQVKKLMADLNAEANNFMNTMYVNFAPNVISGLKSLNAWISENRDGIVGFFKEWTGVMGDLVDAFGGVDEVLKALVAYKIGGIYGLAAYLGMRTGDATTPEEQRNRPEISKGVLFRSLNSHYYSPSIGFEHPLTDEGEKIPITQAEYDKYMSSYTAEERADMDKRGNYSQAEQLKNIDNSLQRLGDIPQLLGEEFVRSHTQKGHALSDFSQGGNYGVVLDKQSKAPAATPVDSVGKDVIGGRLGSGRKLKSGETYKYETGEYYDANGNIVNPVETDAGTISMDRLLDAVAFRESRGNPAAKNPHSTATGAWQFVEGTARDNGLTVNHSAGIDDRLDPEKARAAADILMRKLLKQYNGNVADALFAYAGGGGGVNRVLRGDKGGLNNESVESVYKLAEYFDGINFEASKVHQTLQVPGQPQAQPQFYVNNMEINSQPESVDALSNSIQEQASRAGMNVSFDTMGR
ncbi:transglycosylase SLT domain-containing protein [Morganella morganii]|uniref:transglycosylase SLT domain-containing protein n=1 Tax=Morganella morganii TaxID=582 RepID=UPI001BD30A24|nr:transglycosylase SLT domain-containing protein [Morganella morganii]MBS9584230.1 transglycosylase SLT domain-containing protein [Morganella morganii subsp. morganii]QWL86651.1 transglycosylase SLT domain-containing protein [Morganella morganii subsp. morganii]